MGSFDKRFFRRLMADRELSLRSLAARMDMGHSQLSLTMSGARRLQLAEAAQLAELLGISLQEVAEHAGALAAPLREKHASGTTRHFEELNWLQNRNSSATVASLQHAIPPIQGEVMQEVITHTDAQLAKVSPEAALAPVAPTLPAPTTPAQVVAYAMAHGAPIAEIREFMALQREWEADQARKAYVEAMAQFKLNPPKVVKDKLVEFSGTRYTHATLGAVTEAIVAGLAAHGFTHRWVPQQEGGQITVTCIITHRLGHSESVSLSSGKDDSGKKNAIQQVASAITYLQRYTLLAATGVATMDQPDDDGQGYGLNTALADKWIAEVRKCKNEAEMKGVWTVALQAIKEANDGYAYDEVKAAYAEHKKAMAGAA